MTPTQARDRAQSLSTSAPAEALALARKIKDPWFRCQALSHVARRWPHRDYVRLLDEATEAADAQEGVFDRVAVAAWPIRAYLERDNPDPARRLLDRYARLASDIENLGGRSEALLLLFQAARPFAAACWEPVFRALVAASQPTLAWRQRRNVRLAIQMLAADHPDIVQAAIARLSDGKTVAAIRRDIEAGRRSQPRPFFVR